MVIKIHNINFFIMKHIIRYTVFFVLIFCTAFAAIAQSHNYTGFKEVDKVLTDEDIEKLKEADENNDIANEYLNHATSKQNELLKKKLRVSEKKDQLQKVNSELRGKSKIGRAFAFRKKRKAKKIQKSITEIRKEENIDELEKEVNELLEKAQNQFANHLKFNVYEKYIQEALKTADMSDPDVKKAKAKIEKAKGQFIQFLDADDILHPKKIEIQINALQNSHYKLAVGRAFRFIDTPTVEEHLVVDD